MKKTHTEERTIEEEVVDDIICNRCGESCRCDAALNYEGLIEATICGGYGSKIGDFRQLTFSVCESCLIELFETFKISPAVQDHL